MNGNLNNANAGESIVPRPITVMRGDAGPFPGLRLGEVIAYEFHLPESFVPREGKTQVERVFVLLDVGVQISNPIWWHGEDATTWYVDLVSVNVTGDRFTISDLYIDVIIPTDGRHHRMLDLDEFAAAIADGSLSLAVAIDALTRWQRFLDTYLHDRTEPTADWRDFPPETIQGLAELPEPLVSNAVHSEE